MRLVTSLFLFLLWPFLEASLNLRYSEDFDSLIDPEYETEANELICPEQEYLNSLLDVFVIDDFQLVHEHITNDPASRNFCPELHAHILNLIVNTYRDRKSDRRMEFATEEGIAAYLTYVLNRNFDKSSTFSIPNFYKLKLFRTYQERFAEIGREIILLKQSVLSDIFFHEISKDLDPPAKFQLFKLIVQLTPVDELTSKSFSLFLQSFLKSCPQCIAIEEFASLHRMRPFKDWSWELVLAPVHLGLLGPQKDEEILWKSLFELYSTDDTLRFNRTKAIEFLGKLLKYTKFSSKHRQSDSTDFHWKQQIVLWISKIFFYRKQFQEIFVELIKLEQAQLFESFLLYIPGSVRATQSEVDHFLNLASISTLHDLSKNIQFYDAIPTHNFIVKFELVLLVLAHFKPESPNVNEMTWKDPKVVPILSAIIDQLILIIKTVDIPEKSIGISVPVGASSIVNLNPPDEFSPSEDLAPILERFPIYLFAARIILCRTFRIPIASTRLFDYTNETATWSEAIGFINFYIERFAKINGIENYYQVV